MMLQKPVSKNPNREDIGANEKENLNEKKTMKKWLIEKIKFFGPPILIAWFLLTFVVANAVVPSESMEPTIMTGSRLFGFRLAYSFEKDPEFGDIVIFKYPDDPSILYVKRIIGLPGDIIEQVPYNDGSGNGYLIRNGEVLEEPYLAEEMKVDYYFKYQIPKGKYFFLGDNRNNSNDSRYWKTSYVKRELLVAKVICRYWLPLEFY